MPLKDKYRIPDQILLKLYPNYCSVYIVSRVDEFLFWKKNNCQKSELTWDYSWDEKTRIFSRRRKIVSKYGIDLNWQMLESTVVFRIFAQNHAMLTYQKIYLL